VELQAKARAQSDATHEDSWACLAEAIAYLGMPRHLVDVGCGSGLLVKRLATEFSSPRATGIDLGVETASSGRWSLVQHDLTKPARWLVPGDMVLCWEVGEHLPAYAADALCDTIASVTAGLLLFTAAVPGQGGTGHVNEQPASYWRSKLEARALSFREQDTFHLRRRFADAASRAWWYGRNLQVFVR